MTFWYKVKIQQNSVYHELYKCVCIHYIYSLLMNTKSATTWKIQQLGQQFNYTIAITREKKKEKNIDTMDGTSSVAQNPLKELSDLSFQGPPWWRDKLGRAYALCSPKSASFSSVSRKWRKSANLESSLMYFLIWWIFLKTAQHA